LASVLAINALQRALKLSIYVACISSCWQLCEITLFCHNFLLQRKVMCIYKWSG